ncbi:MAG: DUF2752 domain-containing protein [bacterium]
MGDKRPRFDWGNGVLDIVLSGGAFGVLLISVLLAQGSLPAIPLCQFNLLTGLPCAGCGITRAFCAIGHGDFGAAWNYNPLAFILYPATLVLFLRPLLRRLRPALEGKVVLSPWFGRTTIVVIAMMWVFGVARMLGELSAR